MVGFKRQRTRRSGDEMTAAGTFSFVEPHRDASAERDALIEDLPDLDGGCSEAVHRLFLDVRFKIECVYCDTDSGN